MFLERCGEQHRGWHHQSVAKAKQKQKHDCRGRRASILCALPWQGNGPVGCMHASIQSLQSVCELRRHTGPPCHAHSAS